MNRRVFLQTGIAATLATELLAAVNQDRMDKAAEVLAKAVRDGQVDSAVLHVVHNSGTFTRFSGNARSADAMFLLGSITKPICITALMSLYDQGKLKLDDTLQKFIPEFKGDNRDAVTMRHLMTHVSGLPDQLPENNQLRKRHAGLNEFVDRAIRTPLSFAPGAKYQYSSMGILLACRVAELISGTGILELVDQRVFRPIGMKHSALGLGRFSKDDMLPCQTQFAAPEAGAGDPTAKDWDWNSLYWRKLGAPWGGAHASAPDIALFLEEFLLKKGAAVKPDTAAMMITNQNGSLTPRGLGFNVGRGAGSPGCSEKTFGHGGSTGTFAWADPETQTVCVVLTSLPGAAVKPHPRDVAAEHVAAAVRT